MDGRNPPGTPCGGRRRARPGRTHLARLGQQLRRPPERGGRPAARGAGPGRRPAGRGGGRSRARGDVSRAPGGAGRARPDPDRGPARRHAAAVAAPTLSGVCLVNILVAEDDRVARRMLETILTEWGYQVTAV